MKRALAVTLGILTAIGAFVDIGDLVANAQSGARFGMRQAWIVVVGVIGICVFAEMAGRVAAVSHRPVFDLVRERLGPRTAMANLAGSYLVTLLTLTAEIGGIALTIQLASGLPHLLWVPLAAFAVWVVLWRVKFELMEQLFGVFGLALVVFVVALIALDPPWGITHLSPPSGENWGTWGYVATVFEPAGVQVDQLSQTALPVALSLGKLGLVVVMIGFFAATFGAALETGLSTGYSIAQYFGWQWGKEEPDRPDSGGGPWRRMRSSGRASCSGGRCTTSAGGRSGSSRTCSRGWTRRGGSRSWRCG